MLSEEELKKEKSYLNGVYDTIEKTLEVLNNGIYDAEKEIKEISQYMSNSYYEMDDEEPMQHKDLFEQLQLQFLQLTAQKSLLERQRESAYFGRIDFQADDQKRPYAYYIGISHLLKENIPIPLVLDWRAPLSSMYYDYELGNASYSCPDGEIKGKISLKRQYKTKHNELVYAFDSDLTINDDILRSTLGSNADSKMKNIVATIQTEQNKIIRADESKNLLVQGVAGSGKTSIALHRIAYLLYKNKISSSDVLIISPSSLFSDYISEVLPSLAEENTPKITFDEIAHSELKGLIQFEPKSQMLEALLAGDTERAEEVNYKGTFEFFDNLKIYLQKIVSLTFKAQDLKFGNMTIYASEINKLYNEHYASKNPAVRIEWIADYVVDKLEPPKSEEKALYARTKQVLYTMFENVNIAQIYAQFLSAIGMKFRCVQNGQNTTFVGYEDVPALLYIKDYILGVETDKHYKHIVIDEMQDYSPIAFALLQKIYPANKTILGDIYQSFEKRLDHQYLNDLAQLIGNTKLVKLATTYRSTMQIARFNQNIINLQNVKNYNRQGEEVEEVKSIKKLVENLEEYSQKYDKIAILTPTIKQSNQIFNLLNDKIKLSLIDETSGENNAKISVIPTVYSKGLEFDAVIFVDNQNMQDSQIFTNTKYIACTRALHKLDIVKKL